MPMEGFDTAWDEVYVEGRSYSPDTTPPMRLYKYVSPGFFQTAGTRLVAGREITWSEVYALHPGVMISENLARELWGSPSAAVGKHLREYLSTPWDEVVGVVQDVREKGVQKTAPEIVYWPSLKTNLFGPGPLGAVPVMTFIIRSDRAGTEAFLNEVRQAVWSVNANLPVASVRTMQEVYGKSLARTSFTLVMLAIAGAMALVLGIIGIYGVISYTVSQRQREIGIRLALGAQGGDVLQMVLSQGAKLALVGVAIGIGAAFGLTRLMRNLLFGVTAYDPLTFAAVALLLVFVAVLACYIPARSASRVDPMVALRYE
jgi:predicted permease